jgi:hypothetical protein
VYRNFLLGKDVEIGVGARIFAMRLGSTCLRQSGKRAPSFDLLAHGCVVGTVELYDIVSASRSRWTQEDAWHWLIRNSVRIEPVRVHGRVGLWRIPFIDS